MQTNDNSNSNSVFDAFMAGAEAADEGKSEIPLDASLSKQADQAPLNSGKEDQEGSEWIQDINKEQKQATNSDKSDPNADSNANKPDEKEKDEKKDEVRDESKDTEDSSKYQRAKQNRELRQNLQDWQEKLKKQEKELAERESQLVAKLQEAESKFKEQDQPPTKWSEKELTEAIEDFKQEGREDLVKDAEAQLKALKEWKANKNKSENKPADYRQDNRYWYNAHQIIEKMPELKDATQGIGKELKSLLEQNPEFFSSVNGFSKAVEVAKMKFDLTKNAALVSDLQKQVAEKDKEIQRLTKLTSLNTGAPSSRPAPKTFENLSHEEQLAELERQAEELSQA